MHPCWIEVYISFTKKKSFGQWCIQLIIIFQNEHGCMSYFLHTVCSVPVLLDQPALWLHSTFNFTFRENSIFCFLTRTLKDYVTVAWKGWEYFLNSPDDIVDKSCDLIYPLLYDLEWLLTASDLYRASQFWRLNDIVTDKGYGSRHLMPSPTSCGLVWLTMMDGPLVGMLTLTFLWMTAFHLLSFNDC